MVFEIISEKKLGFNEVAEEIIDKNQELIGKLEMAKSGLTVLNEYKENKGILKINPKYVDKARAAFTLIQDINNNKVIVKSIGVSGTLKKAKNKFLISS